jgi:hypothetical protein
MPRAPEVELKNELENNSTLMTSIKAVYAESVPRVPKFPFIVLNLLGDNNEKTWLGQYGGEADVQIDIYSKDAADYVLRGVVKDAIRQVRGTIEDLKVTNAVVTNEQSFGREDAMGLYRWTVDVRLFYTEV